MNSTPPSFPQTIWKTRLVSLAWAAAFLLFFSLVAGYIVQNKPPPPKAEVRENVSSVRAAAARLAKTRPSVLLAGEVEARDYAVLTSPVEAEVQSVALREGEDFAKGQRLARLDLREQLLEIESRKTAVETVKLQIATLKNNSEADTRRLAEIKNLLEIARREYARNITLQAKNLVAQTQIDGAEQSVNQRRQEFIGLQNQVNNYTLEERRLRQQLAAAGVALKQAELLAERGELRAPFAGKVVKVHASAGSRLSRGAPIMEIFNPESARLRARVPNRYVRMLKTDSRARLVANGKTLELPLTNISPQAESGQGSVEVFFALPPDGWVLGATFEVQLELPAETALELPFDSIYAESRVYRIDKDGRARGVECARLGVSRKNGEVLALLRCPGVAEGDRIIATQLPGLAEGAKVRVVGGVQ
ncbi:MAG: HlyD family efflux transporter periplasmic adaptor subunit [Betaproteobacteria bacterium]|nr:HlyD family efflux transporter periplasmic adaptor subunit [Betaproteobacteria bacterium]